MDEMPKLDDFQDLPSATGEETPEKGRWSQEQRLEFIDFRLGLEGRLNRSDLTRFFNISIPQASLDLARYRNLAPENFRYDAGLKVFLKADTFKPVFRSTDTKHYLNDLWAIHSGILQREGSFIGWMPPFGTVPTPGRAIASETFFKIILAIRERKKLAVQYLSFSRTEPSVREISPHALSNDGFRWHTRAYCETRKEFRDFTIARILNVLNITESKSDPESDKAWKNFVVLELAPHPNLSDAHKRSVEFDYSMANGKLKLECREALLFYAIRKLGLDSENDSSTTVRHLFLSNREELETTPTQNSSADGKQMSLWDIAHRREE